MGMEALREIEEVPMFNKNQVATPARVTSFSSQGGKKTPSVEKDHMRDIGMGKQVEDRFPQTHTYAMNDYNVS